MRTPSEQLDPFNACMFVLTPGLTVIRASLPESPGHGTGEELAGTQLFSVPFFARATDIQASLSTWAAGTGSMFYTVIGKGRVVSIPRRDRFFTGTHDMAVFAYRDEKAGIIEVHLNEPGRLVANMHVNMRLMNSLTRLARGPSKGRSRRDVFERVAQALEESLDMDFMLYWKVDEHAFSLELEHASVFPGGQGLSSLIDGTRVQEPSISDAPFLKTTLIQSGVIFQECRGFSAWFPGLGGSGKTEKMKHFIIGMGISIDDRYDGVLVIGYNYHNVKKAFSLVATGQVLKEHRIIENIEAFYPFLTQVRDTIAVDLQAVLHNETQERALQLQGMINSTRALIARVPWQEHLIPSVFKEMHDFFTCPFLRLFKIEQGPSGVDLVLEAMQYKDTFVDMARGDHQFPRDIEDARVVSLDPVAFEEFQAFLSSGLLHATNVQVEPGLQRFNFFTRQSAFLAANEITSIVCGIVQVRKQAAYFMDMLFTTPRHFQHFELDAIDMLFNILGRELENRHLDAMKNQFISMISHELKTPLINIKGYTELLERDVKSGIRGTSVLETMPVIKRNIQRLESRINDILEMQKLESDRFALQKDWFDIKVVAEQATSEYIELAASKDITLDIEGFSPCLVHGDASKIHVVMSNLLSNAIKFSPPGKVVHVRTSVDEVSNLAHVEIEDEGIGINPGHLDRLFTRFERLPLLPEQEHAIGHQPGTGLGLSLSSSIMLLHGSRLEVSSKGINRGATFSFSLPCSREGRKTKDGTPASSFAGNTRG